MAWLPDSDALTARTALKPLMNAFPFTSCVPFSNNTPLVVHADEPAHERTGLLFRAADHEAPPAETLACIERILGLDGTDTLRYADRKRGQHRTARLHRVGNHAELVGFVLAGDTSAEAWIKTLLQDELPAQAYGRLLLLPGAKAPVAIQSRGKLVCTCLNVTDAAIGDHLQLIHQGGGNAGYLGTDEERLTSLQDTLKCGTNCGSCLPELKRLIRSARQVLPSGGGTTQRTVIPITQIA